MDNSFYHLGLMYVTGFNLGYGNFLVRMNLADCLADDNSTYGLSCDMDFFLMKTNPITSCCE